MRYPADREVVPRVGGRMRRRDFIALVGAVLAWPRQGAAQGALSRPTVAFFSGTSTTTAAQYVSGFLAGLQDGGYKDGREFDLATRYANGDLTRMSLVADEIFQLMPAVVVTGSTAATLAMKRTTTAIPIICAALTDPVGTGLVASHSRPGGNVTGILNNLDTLPGKRLELSREIVPGAHKLGVLVNGGNESNVVQRHDTLIAGRALGIDLVLADVRLATEIEAALHDLARQRGEVVMV